MLAYSEDEGQIIRQHKLLGSQHMTRIFNDTSVPYAASQPTPARVGVDRVAIHNLLHVI